MMKKFVSVLLLTTGLLAAVNATAVESRNLLLQELPTLSGDQEVLMLTVHYAPGEGSTPHRHDAHVFVYVLEGSVVMQVEGAEPVTVQAGDTFQEDPADVHLQSRNASETEPASFLVMMVKKKGAPVTVPVAQGH